MENTSQLFKLTKEMNLINLLKTLGITLVTFLAPIKGLLILMLVVVFLDIFTALWATRTTGEKITSHKMWNSVPKLFFYLGGILLGFLVDSYLVVGTLFGISYFLSKAITVLFLGIETKSIDENLVKMGRESMADSVKNIINFLKGIKKDLNTLKDDDKEKDTNNEDKNATNEK